MNKRTPKTVLVAASVTFLAGVSAAALFAASSAKAQVTDPPFQPPHEFSVGANGTPNASPVGADLTKFALFGGIPGLDMSNQPQILTDAVTGSPIAKGTSGVLNPDGTPVRLTYAKELSKGASGYQGTGNLAGQVLVDPSNKLYTGAVTASQLAGTDFAPAGTYWVSASSQDLSSNGNQYLWKAGTYANDPSIAGVANTQQYGNGAASPWYVLNSNGTASAGTAYSSALSALQASNLSQYNLLQAAWAQGDIAKANAILTANHLAFRYVSQNSVDPSFVGGSIFYQGLITSPQGQGNGTVSVNQGAHASTTSLAGGVLYANDKGQSTALGPGGISIVDNRGGSTIVSGGVVAISGGANTNIGGNVTSLTSSNAALNVTGGAVVNNGLAVNNGLRVSGPSQGQGYQTIDMGGNRVQDVGTPIFGTDAANKAYVDGGLNKAYEGTAIALAISQPIIGPNQTFAIRGGWGTYENESAFGLSAAGIIAHDWFWSGSSVALDGGVGWGSNNSVAGKAGITIAFGSGYAATPLK